MFSEMEILYGNKDAKNAVTRVCIFYVRLNSKMRNLSFLCN